MTDGHRSTARQGRFQCLRPGLPRCEIPPVEKHGEILFAQPCRERLDLRMITPVVTEKDIERKLARD